MEELECIASVDLLRRAGTAVTLAYLGDGSDAPGAEKAVVGKNGITVLADTQLSELPKDAVFDLVMIPGGPGVPGLRKTGEAAGLLKQQALRGGWIGCICAAPVLLKDAGLLEGRRYSCHPSVAKELPDGMTDDVVIDGKILTSRGAGTATAFGLALVAALHGRDKAVEIAESICYSSAIPG